MLTVFALHIVLTCTTQEGANEKDGNNVKDLLPNTVRQKGENPHTVLKSEVCLQSEKAFKNLSSIKELLNFFAS